MVGIIADTTAALPESVAQEYGVPIIPQVVNFGDTSFLEGVDLDLTGFMQRLRSSKELPRTAAPPPDLFVRAFRDMLEREQTILCIHPSSDVSGTVRSATVAAADFPGADIRILDTRLLAGPLATLVTLAVRWARQGIDADTIESRIRDMSARGRCYFVVPTLEYLAKGGRIGGGAALLGSVLRINPILQIRDGRVDALEKVRTHRRAMRRLKEIVGDQYPRDSSTRLAGYLSVNHASAADEAQRLADDLAETLNLEHVPVYDMPPAIVTHAGPGVVAAAFFA